MVINISSSMYQEYQSKVPVEILILFNYYYYVYEIVFDANVYWVLAIWDLKVIAMT